MTLVSFWRALHVVGALAALGALGVATDVRTADEAGACVHACNMHTQHACKHTYMHVVCMRTRIHTNIHIQYARKYSRGKYGQCARCRLCRDVLGRKCVHGQRSGHAPA